MRRILGGTLLIISGVIAAFASALADTVLELRSNFVEKYKNRLTIECPLTIDAAHKSANSAKKDGDLHVAGRCPEVGVNMVAEIQNARSVPDAVDAVHDVEGTGNTIAVVGVWRIWPEHGGDVEHIQRNNVPRWTGTAPTNPPHVFEIHPVTKLGDLDLSETLRPIEGYEAKEAADAFQRYEAGTFELAKLANNRIRMRMRMVGYNYVNFVMQLTMRESTAPDGEFVFADIRNDEGEVLVQKRRIGFVKGTAPYDAEQGMSVGQCLNLLGIPRVDLALVSWRIDHAGSVPNVLRWSLPYEIIAVGVSGTPYDCEEQ